MLVDICDNDERADIFTAGFPCQPFSHMSRKRSPPHQHPLFRQVLIVIRYIRRAQPRLNLLKSVLGFVRDFFFFDGWGYESAFEYLRAQYTQHIASGALN